MWDCRQESERGRRVGAVDYFDAMMRQAVGDNDVWRFEHNVVAQNLVERLLRDRYRRGLVFDNHQRSGRAREHHCVGAALSAVELEAHLIGRQSGRIAEMVDQEGYEMLADPLFGCQRYELAAQRVENIRPVVYRLYAQGRHRQV